MDLHSIAYLQECGQMRGILMRQAIELITLHQMNKSWLHLHVGGIDSWPSNTVEVNKEKRKSNNCKYMDKNIKL